MKKKQFLGARETFEVYEKRAHSPLNNARFPSPIQPPASVPPPQGNNARGEAYVSPPPPMYQPPPMVAFLPVREDKRKVPLAMIVGIAVAVPVFVILMLFLAVWLQEMGIL